MFIPNAFRLVMPCLAFFLFLSACSQQPAEGVEKLSGWMEDSQTALAQAKKENKAVLYDFTGSDWCPPCMALKKEVFASPTFKEFASKNLVLVTVDFPQRRSLPPEQLKRNMALNDKYGVDGQFPTVILTNAEGRLLGGIRGYPQVTASEYVAALQRILKEKPAMEK